MSRNASFMRKIAYITAIALLLLPLSALSQPATVGPRGSTPGGKLSQLRTQYNLSQAELGEIDPASETMKLASLGLKGVAANILWGWANYYKKTEDWDKLELTVEQIIRLQPNFLDVWDFQAHNLSYNVSVEFDDYRMRYQWVKKGIEFLIEGTHYNRDEPYLLYQLGWFTGQKVGRSDESLQFRRMFRVDEDFHKIFEANGVRVDQEQALGPDSKPDNWLVARLWYNRASDAVTQSGRPIRGKSPLLFYSGGPMSQINGSAAMQNDGYFRQRAQISWQRALEEWTKYGNRELPTSYGSNIRLNDLESTRERVDRAFDEMKRLAPGVYDEIRQEKIAKLDPALRKALEKPAGERNLDEAYQADEAERQVVVAAFEIARRGPPESKKALREIVEQIEGDQRMMDQIERSRRIVNFEYWRTRCEAERTDLAQSARADVYNADKLAGQGEKFDEARQLYERGWDSWAQVFEKYPVLMDNAEAQDLIASIKKYRDLLGQLDEQFPTDFKLNKLLDAHQEGRELREQVKLLNEAEAAGTTPPPATESAPPIPRRNLGEPELRTPETEASPPATPPADTKAPNKAN